MAQALEKEQKRRALKLYSECFIADKNELIDAHAIAIGSPNYRDAMMQQ